MWLDVAENLNCCGPSIGKHARPSGRRHSCGIQQAEAYGKLGSGLLGLLSEDQANDSEKIWSLDRPLVQLTLVAFHSDEAPVERPPEPLLRQRWPACDKSLIAISNWSASI